MNALPGSTTALVVIDLQHGIVGRTLAPRSGKEVVAAVLPLAARFRDAGAPVVLVNVDFGPDFALALKQPVDRPMPSPKGGPAPDFAELVEGLAHAGDLRVTKHNWGAFFGTDLDVQLRRRGVTTVVIAGIATNLGVESTARQAHEHGYAVVIVEDATSSLSAAMHEFAIGSLFPLIARVVGAADIEIDAA